MLEHLFSLTHSSRRRAFFRNPATLDTNRSNVITVGSDATGCPLLGAAGAAAAAPNGLPPTVPGEQGHAAPLAAAQAGMDSMAAAAGIDPSTAAQFAATLQLLMADPGYGAAAAAMCGASNPASLQVGCSIACSDGGISCSSIFACVCS